MRQGYSKQIDIKGICRAMSQSNGVDGVTDDMLNLRKENGSWKAMKTLEKVFPSDDTALPYSRIWVHVGNDYKHVFGVLDGALYWFGSIVEGNWQEVSPAKMLCAINDEDLCHENGNLVTVGGDKFLLWKQGDSSYILYDYDQNGEPSDETLAPDGDVDFRVVQDRDDEGNIKIVELMRRYDDSLGKYNRQDEIDQLSAAYKILKQEHEANNSFHSPFLVCAAWKTYNGDYVLATRPMLMYPQSRFSLHENASEAYELQYTWDSQGYISSIDRTQHNSVLKGNRYIVNYLFDKNSVSPQKGETSTQWEYNYHYILNGNSKINEDVSYYSVKFPRKGDIAKVNNMLPINLPRPYGFTDLHCVYTPDTFFPTKNIYKSLCDYGSVYLEKFVFRYFLNGCFTKLQMRCDKPSAYNNEIYTKLCVFATPMVDDFDDSMFDEISVGSYKSPMKLHTDYENYFSESPRKRTMKYVKDKLMSSNFYLLSEVDAASLNGGWVDVEIEEGVLKNITQQLILPADTTNRDGIKARGSYSYNGRLHLFDYDRTQFHGYPLSYFFENEVEGCVPIVKGYDNRVYGMTKAQAEMVVGNKTKWLNEWNGYEDKWSWYVGVEIEREDGKCQVVRYAPFQTDAFKLLGDGISEIDVYAREFFSLNGCLSYPDSRAKKMTIYIRSSVKNPTTGDVYKHYYREFDLTPHERLNMACYISNDLKPIDMTERNNEIQPSPNPQIDPTKFDEFNTSHHYANGLRVSAVDNPLYLPAEYSYFVGNTGIVGMMANEVAVGTGQTGDAPLMVFTKDGVFGLFVDSSGQLAYQYARPICSDVCNNAASIVRVDGGIVFGTERGLYMLKGATAVDIGEIAEGSAQDFMRTLPSTPFQDFPNVVRGAFVHYKLGDFGRIVDGKPVSSMYTQEDFRYYQMGACVGYDHKEQELIVANDLRDYCYIKDYEGRWRRLSQKVSEVIPCYPDTYVLSNGAIYTLDRFKSNGGMRRVWIMTRPISLQSIGYRMSDAVALKENYRVILRGEFETKVNTQVGLYVLGSYDGRRWECIGGNERSGKFVDIGCLVERVDVKYLCIVVSGDIGEDGRIDELLVETKYKH